MEEVDLSDGARALGGSRVLRARLALPEGDGPWPGVVMIHEVFGLDEVMTRQARRLAALGYATLALDLYSDGGARRCLTTIFRAVASGVGRPFADVEAGRRWLAEAPWSTGRVGVLGFCMGGAFALLAAPRGFDAAAVNYGQLPKDLDTALAGACPIVASYGGRDRSLRGAAARLEAALERLGIDHDVTEYPSAGHSFLNDAMAGPAWLRPLLRVGGVGPDPEASRDAWARIDAFLGVHLT
ncbi:MAG TPA: dienelactone hydrolase family protein [Acidimicrobiales bacterium]|nr:dienelactone hydrolase family protein [Acidimicrobiales bacterium]